MGCPSQPGPAASGSTAPPRPRYCRNCATPPLPPPPRLSLHKMAARRGHSERRRGDKMAPGGQRGEGRTMGGCGGRGGERGLQPSQERGGGAPPDVRIPSRQAAKALRVKPDLPPFPPPLLLLAAFAEGCENAQKCAFPLGHGGGGGLGPPRPRRHRRLSPPPATSSPRSPHGTARRHRPLKCLGVFST